MKFKKSYTLQEIEIILFRMELEKTFIFEKDNILWLCAYSKKDPANQILELRKKIDEEFKNKLKEIKKENEKWKFLLIKEMEKFKIKGN